ncbi:exported hypothetical protein [Sulfurovum sp. enrichment culture clone C5]|uniref:Lipoprotein n=1 Tax=Sulfurovum sp. enrichment culture clone C5 TaxID=497650 RepID=A0A0S4XPP6_9BACT|nr:exported hypothetical protein [Sulfurovum sp. enrichment culture clone C5]
MHKINRFIILLILVGIFLGCSPVIKEGYMESARPLFSTKNPNLTLQVATQKCKEASKDKLLKCFLNLKSNCNKKVEDIDIIAKNPSNGERYSNSTVKNFYLGENECNMANQIEDTSIKSLASYKKIEQWNQICNLTVSKIYEDKCLDETGFEAREQKKRKLELEPWIKLNIIQ